MKYIAFIVSLIVGFICVWFAFDFMNLITSNLDRLSFKVFAWMLFTVFSLRALSLIFKES